MLARVARYEVEAQRIDDAVQAFSEAATQVEELQGFAGGFVLVGPEDGRTMTLTLWENSATLENSEPVASRARRCAGWGRATSAASPLTVWLIAGRVSFRWPTECA